MITTEDIKHIAKLSKLEFSENEIENFKEELGQIVEYVNTLSKIDTSSVNLENEAINLNNLRHVNDVYGHEEGDKLIKLAANVLIRNQLDQSY